MTQVCITDLSKSFDTIDGRKLSVINRICLDVMDNDFVCIVGPSGCGKSTLLNMISGLLPFDSGQISFGNNVKRKDIRIGYVFQEPRLLLWKTLAENVAIVLRALGLPEKEVASRVRQYLELVGLKDFADYYPLMVSGGMQQRASIARAWAIEPDLLLMDEPFSHLDELTARKLRILLTEVWSKVRRSVIFVTHNAYEAVLLANRVIVTTQRPTAIAAHVAVDIERPRDPDDPRLLDLQKKIVRTLDEGEKEALKAEGGIQRVKITPRSGMA